MRILYLITELDEGGAENALARVAAAMADRGWTVRAAALFHGSGPPGERLRAAGIPVLDFALSRARFHQAPGRVRALAAEFAPAVIHSWLFHANLAAKLGLPRGAPLVCGLRVVEPRPLHTWLDRLTRRRARLYACVSPAVANYARRRLGVPETAIRVIGNGVDRPPPAPRPRPRERLAGLTVARLTPQKGLDILLRALARLPQALPWEWDIAGDAPSPGYASYLEDLGRRLGLGEQVHWRGPVPRDALAAWYRRANLFALPSRWEGQPNALLEAVAWGLPAVASAVDGARDLAAEAPGCIRLVPPENPDALAAAILAAFHHDASASAPSPPCAPLLERHAWPRIIEAWERLYREISDKRLTPPGLVL